MPVPAPWMHGDRRPPHLSDIIPVPSKWIGWALAGLCALAFGIALACPTPTPSERIVNDVRHLAITQQKHDEAKQRADSLRPVVKAAHERTQHALATLKPLRDAVVITPNSVTVNGSSDSATVIHGLVAVIQHQDSALTASQDENRAKDLRHVSDSTVNVTGEAVVLSATTLGTDALKEAHPRCSATCGIVIGGTVVTIAAIALHFVR